MFDVVLFPRLHLAEIEDQKWCPSFLREHTHRALARTWKAATSSKGSAAQQAAQILINQLGGLEKAAEYTFVDACAGAGGPTPIIEKSVNEQMKAGGFPPVQFVLTDLWPDLNAWKTILSQSKNITSIDQPMDATSARRIAPPGKKECKIFNLSFHHFDDPIAEKALLNVVDTSDSFVIFELTHRTLPALLNTTLIILSPFITTLYDWWWSPLHLIFTYLVPVIPLFYAIDGYVSCARTRTSRETWALLTRRSGLSVQEWEQKNGWVLQSGREVVLPPLGTLFYYSGVKVSSNGAT